jgi:futalosine hydrolase
VRLLAVVATPQEQAALVRSVEASPLDLGPYRACRTAAADVVVAGIGPAAAAAGTAHALASGGYDACLSLGICGAFRGTAEIGDTVVATELVAADLGADSPTGFLGLGALGWADEVAPVDEELLATVVQRLGNVVTGPVLTVSTVTGTRARADELALRHGAVAEAMEGWGVRTAAAAHGLPTLEVRTVSNLVTDRDKGGWDITAAFDALDRVGAALLGAPWR